MFTWTRQPRFPWHLASLFFLGWALLTFYPRPGDLARSVYRVFRPPVDATLMGAHAHLFADLDHPAEIDQRVRELFPYQFDWVSHNRPWYFPTLDEAFLVMTGDCKTHLLVLASILEYRGIPYTLSASPTHVWVEYPGKHETRGENTQVSFFSINPDSGTRQWKLPSGVNVQRSLDSFWTAFWRYMPLNKRRTIAVGFFLSILLGTTLSVFQRLQIPPQPAPEHRCPGK